MAFNVYRSNAEPVRAPFNAQNPAFVSDRPVPVEESQEQAEAFAGDAQHWAVQDAGTGEIVAAGGSVSK